MKRKKWQPRIESADMGKVENIVRETGVHSIIAEMLLARGIDTVEAINHFFNDDLDDLYDPFLMKDILLAVERIDNAIKHDEKIVIYGDYDVDGITSTSVLMRCLQKLGAEVIYYIPEREREGYGLNEEALAKLASEDCTLLITVDCGIGAVDLVAAYNTQMDIIITDHHMPGDIIPPAFAVLNPKQNDCTYPEKNLAGVGVAYTLCRALWQHFNGKDYDADLELVALGTVADVVPLLNENRIYVREGLKRFADSDNVGINELLEVSGIRSDEVTSERISFALAPRLNAAGRLTHARSGVNLLTAMDSEEAKEQALELQNINSERRIKERELYIVADLRINELKIAEDGILVVDGENWHPGVIGIVASRLVEKYNRSAVMISVEDGIGKGSCRSIRALDIYDALASCEDLLIEFGGHHQAAGFTIEAKNIPELRRRLVAYADTLLTEEDYIPVLEIEKIISLEDANEPFIEMLSLLEPYGEGNPFPIFASKEVTVADMRQIGAEKTHLKGKMEQAGTELEMVGWGCGHLIKKVFRDDVVSIAYSLQINEWQNKRQAQGVLKDVRIEKSDDIILNRDILVDIYKAIKHYMQHRKYPDYFLEELLDSVRNYRNLTYSHKMIYTAIQVFIELGIIEKTTSDNGERYRLCEVAQKQNLHTSLTYLAHSEGG